MGYANSLEGPGVRRPPLQVSPLAVGVSKKRLWTGSDPTGVKLTSFLYANPERQLRRVRPLFQCSAWNVLTGTAAVTPLFPSSVPRSHGNRGGGATDG